MTTSDTVPDDEPARVTTPRAARVTSSLLADQVFDRLRSWITSGQWKPGTQMRIREVAAKVGTSEMPVREAFRRLEQAGLIVIEPYRGARVPLLTIDELEHVYDVRVMLEPQAARLGANLADAAVVAEMQRHWQLLQVASERGDVSAAVRHDEDLLTALYDAGGNDVLNRLIKGIWDTCRPYKNLWVANAVRHGLTAWGHVPALIDAASHGDGDSAFATLDRTYRDARAVVRQLLSDQPES